MVPEHPYRKQSQSSSPGDRLGARDQRSHFAPSFPRTQGVDHPRLNAIKFPLARWYSSGYYARIFSETLYVLMNIGETIRNYRLQKGMSQGDIEKRTGLLRCYLSRVENGHTIPSLDTLSKIAGAMDLPLSQFFSEGRSNGHKGLPQLSDDEVRFLSQIRRYATNLNDSDRKLVLAMVKKMAVNTK
jgi:transcriptional regulator with XRE-family HTH domain